MKNLFIFPAAFMANTFAMMLIMIGLSLFGRPDLAADFGIVHGATVALFYSFSGNARSIILARTRVVDSAYILRLRCLLVIPLGALAFVLSIGLVASGWLFVLLLIVRRACEWLAEVFLSEQEHDHQSTQAVRFFLTQGVASLLVLLALSFDSTVGLWVLAVWAVTPLCWCIRPQMFAAAFKKTPHGKKYLKLLLPHFGSTAAIGVSVYVFRLFIVLLVGRHMAGDLFSAFALGGILGAVFTQALGPTLVRNESNSGRSSPLVRWVNLIVGGSLLVGVLVAAMALLRPELLLWTGKGGLFWLAVGCSLTGGAIMVKAQRVRLRLLQNSESQDAFGSDMLANILLIGCIPFLFYGLGATSLAGLYLLGAILSLVFYVSEKDGLFSAKVLKTAGRWILPGLAFVLFIPLFFQLSGGIYQGEHPYFSSEGKLALLPIPVSVLACYAGIVILGGYTKARLSLITVFFLFMGMLFTSLLLAAESGIETQSKLILLVQYILPVFALVLGQQYGMEKGAISKMAKVWFFILLIFVPLETISTMAKNIGILSPSVYLFSIYQHLQYVPVIFAGGYVIALFALSEEAGYRKGLLLLSVIIGMYAAFAFSMLAYALIVTGVLVFFIRSLLLRKGIWHGASMVLMVGLGIAMSLAFVNGAFLRAKFGIDLSFVSSIPGVSGVANIFGVHISAKEITEAPTVLNNRDERLVYWHFYLSQIFDSFSSFWLGHAGAPDRTKFPSAHNYYLDFIYNFGFLAVLPLLGLVAFTVWNAVRNTFRIWASSEVLGVLGVVLFFVLADNMLKVGMRQPYPGIITFFLWGIILTVLSQYRSGKAESENDGVLVDRKNEE
ncbi:hypothetical protein [Pseudomonas sp. PD9R]|uniref:hypothetical protein n=1 Tax=Pseudomonas sp. PD9R TaxID=2853534 RepID=UPI001C443487|nr:hypothetical protein [Pseudomonas sp. PD9R]MBV6824262.1 hypothetical protein [Pseudomonas sp. PD9R]